MAKVLVIEDDPAISLSLRQWFSSEQHDVETADTGMDGLQLLNNYGFDLVVLDWELPDMSGVRICQQYRKGGGKVPVLMLTGRGSLDDKSQGLDSGADDYLTKPFAFQEFGARVRALLRRSCGYLDSSVDSGEIRLDHRKFSLVYKGETIKLLPREFSLIEFLLRHPGQFVPSETILKHVWPSEAEGSTDALRATFKRLRDKLAKANAENLIESSRGYGYKIVIASGGTEQALDPIDSP